MNGRSRAGGIIAIIVLCSALAGAAVDRVYVQRLRHRGGPGGSGGPGAGGPGRGSREQDGKRRVEMLDRMSADLDLTPTQKAGIDSVLQHTDSSLRLIRTEMQPRLQAVFDSSRASLLSRLDQQQREKFEKDMPRRRR